MYSHIKIDYHNTNKVLSTIMTDNFSVNEIESKLSLIIRKPQEGKTFICMAFINKDADNKIIHLVLTMNTLSAGMQFFGRMEEQIDSKNIIVFNSKKETAGKCLHAKNVTDIFSHIRKNPNIKVIVCCAHEKRIRFSIPELLERASDSISFNHRFKIHVDEAHKYIPANRDNVRNYNELDIVDSIIGYSATPDGIWSDNVTDILFHKILIRDVEKELLIIRSPDYFGVKCCDFNIFEQEVNMTHQELIEYANIDPVIPQITFDRAGMKENTKNRNTWYSNDFIFNLGNEILLLSYISYIIPNMNIPQNSFSYHFIPGYNRKATHYEIVELLLKLCPTANVITLNGNGFELYRINQSDNKSYKVKSGNQISELASYEYKKVLREPSNMIQELIKDNVNCPTFVTGLQCAGMSVTFINENIGNFDSVIMAHQHYNRDTSYQLNRYLFNYTTWSLKSKSNIKKTKFFSLTKKVVDICLEYEQHVEHISEDLAGRTVSLRETQGLEPVEPSEKELKKIALKSVKLINSNNIWKKFKVYEGNDDDEWGKVKAFYEEKINKKPCKKSLPKLVNGLYECSTTKNVAKHHINDINKLNKQSWWSCLQLTKSSLSYARIFVGYDNLNDPSEYTIFVKYVLLEDNQDNKDILEKYY
jgi:hypothetical protein